MPELNWIWRAWHRLHPDRPQHSSGMGPSVPGDIPWTTVLRWAEYHDMTPGETALLDMCVQAMDRVFREHWMRANEQHFGGKKSDGRQR